MKKLLFLIPLLNFQFAMSANIEYLDPDEIKDLDYCSKKVVGISYNKLNKLPNNSILLDRDGDLNNKLMHNFVYDMYYYDHYSINGSVITSATLRFSNSANITNSVVSNMTFVGDVSKINFRGSCLVNVRFPKETSWRIKRKIKKEALYYKNLEYKDEYEPWN